MLPLFLSFLSPIISALPSPSFALTGILLAAVYEITLQNTLLKAWVLTAPRTSLLSQNKEGITSSIGYVAIFLVGMETGMQILPRHFESGLSFSKRPVSSRSSGKSLSTQAPSAATSRKNLILCLILSSLFYTVLFLPFSTPYYFRWLSIPTSRRLANAPYVFWVAAFNTGQLAFCAIVETVLFPEVYRASTQAAEKAAAENAMSRVVADFNGNGLFVFLIANLATGLVNMGINTLEVDRIQAVGVLVVYMATLAVVARSVSGMRIKL